MKYAIVGLAALLLGACKGEVNRAAALRAAYEPQNASCTGPNGSWHCKSTPPATHAQLFSNAVPPPPVSPSCKVPHWVFDPANVSTCAADGNDCTHTACSGNQGPCATIDQIMQRIGGSCTWGQATVIEQMSADTTAAHPWTLQGTLVQGATLAFECDLPAATVTSTLTAATAKVRTSNTVQTYSDSVNFGSVAVGTLVKDTTTGANSWVASKPAATAAFMTQPLAAMSTPATTLVPAESDAANSGDTYSVYALNKANLVAINVAVADVGSYADAGVLAAQPITISNCELNDPAGVAQDPLYVGLGVTFSEVKVDRILTLSGGEGEPFDVGCVNCFLAGGLQGGRASTGRRWRMSGGILYPSPGAVYNPAGMGITLDGDPWIGSNLTLPSGGTLSSFNAQRPTSSAGDAGTTVNGYGFVWQGLTTNGYTAPGPLPYSWGGGWNNAEGSWHFDSSDGGATGINANYWTVNGQITACAVSYPVAAVATWVCNIAVSNQTLDNGNAGIVSDAGFAERAWGAYGATLMGNAQ